MLRLKTRRLAAAAAPFLIATMAVTSCSGPTTMTQSAPTASRTTGTPVAAPITCRDAEPHGSGQWSTTEFTSLLEGQGNIDAKAMLHGIKGLSFQPDAVEDAIRAWLFTAKDQAEANAATTRVINGFGDRCSFTIVEDMEDLKSKVPNLSASKITTAGDTFGFCRGAGGAHELGWIKLARVYSCDNELLSIDFANRRIGYTKIEPGPNSTFTSSGVSGGKVIWVTTTMHPVEGLNKTTFDATIHTSDSLLKSDVTTDMYRGFPSGQDPAPTVAITQEGFAYFSPSDSSYEGEHSHSLWNVSGKAAVEIPSSSLPRYGEPLDTPNVDISLKGLMPLYRGSESKYSTDLHGVYFDTVNQKLLQGMVIREYDGGCGVLGVGQVESPYIGSNGLRYTSPPHPAFFSTVSTGKPAGMILKDENAITSDGSVSMAAATGFVPSQRYESSGHYLKKYNGETSWTIDPSVAVFQYSVLGRMRMKNASGAILYVNPNTGKEDSSLSSKEMAILRALDKYDGSSENPPSSLRVWDHDDDTTILAVDPDQDVYVLSRKAFCNLGAVSPGTSALPSILSKW